MPPITGGEQEWLTLSSNLQAPRCSGGQGRGGEGDHSSLALPPSNWLMCPCVSWLTDRWLA